MIVRVKTKFIGHQSEENEQDQIMVGTGKKGTKYEGRFLLFFFFFLFLFS
jgi:hypothetical protein